MVRSADLIDYTAEEGLRFLGEGQLLAPDSFPGHARNKLCLVSKVDRGQGDQGPRSVQLQTREMGINLGGTRALGGVGWVG